MFRWQDTLREFGLRCPRQFDLKILKLLAETAGWYWWTLCTKHHGNETIPDNQS